MAFLVLALALTAGSPLPIPVHVELEGPPECPDVADFYEDIHARTDKVRRAQDDESGPWVRIRLSRSGSWYQGELHVLDESGKTDTRKVEGGTCSEVARALSLTAALAFDPDARLTAPSKEEKATPITAPPLVTSDPASSKDPLSIELGAEAVVAQPVTPSLATGVGVETRLARGLGGLSRSSLALGLLYAQNDFLSTQGDPRIAWTGVSLTACPLHWSVTPILALEPCALGIGGVIAASGKSVASPESVTRSWWSAGAIARVAVQLGLGYAVELSPGLQIPLARRRFFTTTPEHIVGETPTLCGFLALGMAYSFR